MEEERIEIFSPPYLFRGGIQPAITDAPAAIDYGASFSIKCAEADTIK